MTMSNKIKNQINIGKLIDENNLNFLFSEKNYKNNEPFISKNISISDIFKRFIQVKKNSNLRERTIKEHIVHQNYFKDYLFKNKPYIKNVGDITMDDINDYITYMTEKSVWSNHPTLHRHGKDSLLKPTTINTRLRTLKCLFNHLYENGLIKENFASRIKLLETDTEIKTFSQEDIERLLAQFGPLHKINKYSELRDYTIILLLIETGTRIEQLLSIEIQNIDMIHKQISLSAQSSKGRQQHKIYFSNATARAIELLIEISKERRNNNTFLFLTHEGSKFNSDTFRKELKKYASKAGIKGVRVSPHTFRHFFAITYLNNGGSLPALMKLLDHKDITTTMRYLDLSHHKIQESFLAYCPKIG